jgi:hypothetical protein
MPIHLISIEIQNTDNNPGNPQRNLFFIFICYNLAIHVVILSEIFYKILQ